MANTYNICNKLQAIADAITQGGGGGGGTTVIANPSGTPTDTLNTIQIASTIYDIAGGASSADNVSYDNTTSGLAATNVQDAIDENADNISTLNSNITANNFVNSVNLAPYNTPQTAFVCPTDGYVYISRTSNSPGLARVIIFSADNSNAVALAGYSTSTYLYQNSLFVRKGMRLMYGDGNAIFWSVE